ncbi:hypothetical protein GCM10010172_61180 [Paractinoplanes ferrugineus]|uniref:Uncharacterized protein n=1 Tax=Paractinoplanes ferrugineus TaxID=113564 RepID=A0A919MH49_9ACTN|nr:hypothetical protein [Actinoplanes ferrugineus]GIE14554.1 hypothetical protein Afe05nite_63940 [Actinoplanes ferrugineus]
MIQALNIMSGILFVLVLATALGRGIVAELDGNPAGNTPPVTVRGRQFHVIAKIMLIVLLAALAVCLFLRMYVELRHR